jgi:hypothetical protein
MTTDNLKLLLKLITDTRADVPAVRTETAMKRLEIAQGIVVQELKAPEPIRVVVACDGGLIQDVLSTAPIDLAVIDYDVEDMDDERLIDIPQDDETAVRAYAYAARVDVMPERVKQLFDAI